MHGARTLIAALGSTLLMLAVSSAHAEPPVLARLVGGHGGGGHAGHGGGGGGPFLGVDGGISIETASNTDAAHRAASFGVRLGYETRFGLAVFGRYDDLGVAPVPSAGPLQAITAGVRYVFPPFTPSPYVEALAGAAFASSVTARATAGAGVGLTAPIGPVAFDLGARDYVASFDSTLRHVFGLQAGIAVVF